jgi:outer membrane scaffolding protein for murein synthesis (MipA/OmpV family)
MKAGYKVCYPSAARTTTPTAMDRQKRATGARGLVVILHVSAVTATPALTVTIQGYNPLSGLYYTILASAVIATTGTVILRVYPGLTAAANLTVSDVLPLEWRVIVEHGDADSATYSVTAQQIP